jgi:ribosomal protein S18 acetylase RimI-like enzyme
MREKACKSGPPVAPTPQVSYEGRSGGACGIRPGGARLDDPKRSRAGYRAGALPVGCGQSLPSVTDTREGLLRLLATDRQALLVAEEAGAAIGSLIAAWDGWRGSFYRLAVHLDRRRQGIATALLRDGERRQRARGAVRLTAIVAEDDATAMGFWRATGYRRQTDRARFVRILETDL